MFVKLYKICLLFFFTNQLCIKPQEGYPLRNLTLVLSHARSCKFWASNQITYSTCQKNNRAVGCAHLIHALSHSSSSSQQALTKNTESSNKNTRWHSSKSSRLGFFLFLVELQEERGRSIPIGRIVHDLGPAQRTRLLPIEPGAHAQLAEDVITLEQHGTVEIVVTDWALATASLQLLLRRDRSVALGRENTKMEQLVSRWSGSRQTIRKRPWKAAQSDRTTRTVAKSRRISAPRTVPTEADLPRHPPPTRWALR